MKYSLADYIMTITVPTDLGLSFDSISLGGEGSYVGSIEVSMNTNMWETSGDATGGYVHNKSYDRTGMATVELNQLATQVSRLKTLFNIFYEATTQSGLTITVSDNSGNVAATCNDCLIQKIPNQRFGATAETQSWQFTCGKVVFN